MAYQVLARKYRPQRFSDVAGQEHVTRTLLNALAQGRIAHGYIFSGHRGIGKTTIARILAMALNCRTEVGSAERPTPEPCGVCHSCEEIRSSNSVDVLEIDAATNRGIDEIRELREAARYRPSRDRYKIYILDEAHQITDAAFNALLKTLEEPPDHVVFMMATTEPENIPQTIRSRCQHYSFHAVRFDDILTQLRTIATEENLVAEDAALALLAEAGDGSMRDALSIMDQAIASANIEDGRPHLEADAIRELMGTVPNAVFERLMESISENNSAELIEEVNRLLNAGNSPVQLARQFVRYLRNALMSKIGGENTELLQISPDERARAARSAMLFSEEDITRFLQIMLRTFDELNYRQEQRFHLELGLIKLVHLQRLLPVEEFLSQLPRGTSLSTGGAPRSASTAARPTSTSSAPSRPAPPPAPARPQEPPKPAFSPFEADRNRKITGSAEDAPSSTPAPVPEATTPTAPQAEMKSATAEAAPSRPLTPMESASRAAESAPAKPSIGVGHAEPERTEGALALASNPQDKANLDHIAQTVCEALEREGHSTAAVLLSSGRWTDQGKTIQAEVAIKRVMLGLTFNTEAERICKAALQTMGVTQKLSVVPGENLSSHHLPGTGAAKPARPVSGSIQAAALNDPLVKKAQELFDAEVRSVLDLRE
ncbi:MAG: DNA polymerase III subunit gamma/tau [Acidobacteriaceae bacterium]